MEFEISGDTSTSAVLGGCLERSGTVATALRGYHWRNDAACHRCDRIIEHSPTRMRIRQLR